jgi:Putative auto-transporter adhesin, head GIN domain
MKTTSIVSYLSFLLLLTSCVVNIQDTVTGNGKVTTQKRDVEAFTGIEVGSGIDVILTQGEPQSVEVEADENLLEWINTEVTGGVLHIKTDKSIRFAKTKIVRVTCQTLDRIGVSSAGDVSGTNRFKMETLDIDMSSAGDLRLEVEANAIRVNISSAGNVTLTGSTGSLKADLSSAGDLNAFDLEAKTGDVSVSSAGSARVFITDEASFRSSSAGDIDYKGEPRVREINTSSAGSVNKK